jgi:hypothetical protein
MSDIVIYTDGIAKRVTDMTEDEIMELFSKCLIDQKEHAGKMKSATQIDYKTALEPMTV